jgi:TIR domain
MPLDATFPRVFVSYARRDGAAIAADLRQRLEAAGVSLWQDLVAMEGGQDWWRQIQHAVDKAEYLVLILTPAPSPPRCARTSGATPARSAPT